MALQQHLLDLFRKPGRWNSLVKDQAYISLKGDMLRASVKLRYDLGAQRPADVPFEGLAKWLGQWAGMTKEHAQWVEAYAAQTISGEAHNDAATIGSQKL